MDEFLATKTGEEIFDKGFNIEVKDNGIGMTPDEVNAFYLVVGAERRSDPKRGELSQNFKRKVMGRKGVGKLAPFGICEKIEIISAGGKQTTGTDEDGNRRRGYLTAHLILTGPRFSGTPTAFTIPRRDRSTGRSGRNGEPRSG